MATVPSARLHPIRFTGSVRRATVILKHWEKTTDLLRMTDYCPRAHLDRRRFSTPAASRPARVWPARRPRPDAGTDRFGAWWPAAFSAAGRVLAVCLALLGWSVLAEPGSPATAGGLSNIPPAARGSAADVPGQNIQAGAAWRLQSGSPSQVYSHGNPTVAEQYTLELINRGRLNPAGEAAIYQIDLNEGLAADTISSTPKPTLAFNQNLILSARGHSQWMLDRSIFSHTGADGTDPSQRMKNAGYVFSGSWSWGENIAWRGTTGPVDLYSMAAGSYEDLFVDEGYPERGHRVNLMNDDYREIGIGIIVGKFNFNGRSYNTVMTTQDFGKTGAQPTSFLVGVVFRDLNGDGFYNPGEELPGLTVMPSAGQYYAITSDSGGFAIPLSATSGTLPVTLSGGTVEGPVIKTVLLTGRNVKLDFNTAVDLPNSIDIALTSPGLVNGRFTFGLRGPIGRQVMVQSSTDLRQWTNRQTIALEAGAAFVEPILDNTHGRFYRLVQP